MLLSIQKIIILVYFFNLLGSLFYVLVEPLYPFRLECPPRGLISNIVIFCCRLNLHIFVVKLQHLLVGLFTLACNILTLTYPLHNLLVHSFCCKSLEDV